jgi:hypothetical protein
VLLPKADGGARPIGIFPTILRLIDRFFRMQVGVPWLRKQSAADHFGQKGRSCEAAVWRQAALSEWSVGCGRETATIFVDIAKAYENIRHDRLWKAGVKFDFPLWWLRWLISTFLMPRTLHVGGVALAPVRARLSVVPGSSAADLMMRLMMMTPLERVKKICPAGAYAVVVDDLQVLLHAPAGQVATQARRVADEIFEALQVEAGLPVSLPKLVVTGSSATLRKNIMLRSRLLRNAAKKSVRNLGMDYCSGCRANATVRTKRLAEAGAKASRCRALHTSRKVATWMVKCSIGPGVLFGVSITGISPGHLSKVRAIMHKAIHRKTSCRSTTWDLAMDGSVDPTGMCMALPLSWLSAACSQRLLGRGMIRQAHQKAYDEMINHGAACWKRVAGPIGAAVSAAIQLNWVHVKDMEWKTVDGLLVDLQSASPYDIKKLALRDSEHLASVCTSHCTALFETLFAIAAAVECDGYEASGRRQQNLEPFVGLHGRFT